MESRQTVLKNLLTEQQWRNRQRESTYGHGERGGEGEMHGESNRETYITICKIDSQGEFALWLRKLKQGFCINPAGWDGKGDGREVQKGGDICISQFSSVAQACPTLCDPMNFSTPGLPVHHQHPEYTQTHVHRVGDAIQPSHPLLPSPHGHKSVLYVCFSIAAL